MPTVNIYQRNKEFEYKLKLVTPSLKKLVVKELSGPDIQLNVDEVSVRIIDTVGDGMLAPVEAEISAASFKPRVDRQDEICLAVQGLLKDALNADVKVWLILSELGHSWN